MDTGPPFTFQSCTYLDEFIFAGQCYVPFFLIAVQGRKLLQPVGQSCSVIEYTVSLTTRMAKKSLQSEKAQVPITGLSWFMFVPDVPNISQTGYAWTYNHQLTRSATDNSGCVTLSQSSQSMQGRQTSVKQMIWEPKYLTTWSWRQVSLFTQSET